MDYFIASLLLMVVLVFIGALLYRWRGWLTKWLKGSPCPEKIEHAYRAMVFYGIDSPSVVNTIIAKETEEREALEKIAKALQGDKTETGD